jgi:hypothetical protein
VSLRIPAAVRAKAAAFGAVLKLCVPRPGAAAQHEITVLRLVNGEGCRQMLAAADQIAACPRSGQPQE